MKMTVKQMKLVSKAYNRLEAMENEQDLKRNGLTLLDYGAAIQVYNELVHRGVSETFMGDVADWFERMGFKVTRENINYEVTI